MTLKPGPRRTNTCSLMPRCTPISQETERGCSSLLQGNRFSYWMQRALAIQVCLQSRSLKKPEVSDTELFHRWKMAYSLQTVMSRPFYCRTHELPLGSD